MFRKITTFFEICKQVWSQIWKIRYKLQHFAQSWNHFCRKKNEFFKSCEKDLKKSFISVHITEEEKPWKFKWSIHKTMPKTACCSIISNPTLFTNIFIPSENQTPMEWKVLLFLNVCLYMCIICAENGQLSSGIRRRKEEIFLLKTTTPTLF